MELEQIFAGHAFYERESDPVHRATLISDPIAVVVDPITRLIVRRERITRLTADTSIDTAALSLAGTNTTTSRRDKALISAPVTVIIKPVAAALLIRVGPKRI